MHSTKIQNNFEHTDKIQFKNHQQKRLISATKKFVNLVIFANSVNFEEFGEFFEISEFGVFREISEFSEFCNSLILVNSGNFEEFGEFREVEFKRNS